MKVRKTHEKNKTFKISTAKSEYKGPIFSSVVFFYKLWINLKTKIN